jgi:hypothetical protein
VLVLAQAAIAVATVPLVLRVASAPHSSMASTTPSSSSSSASAPTKTKAAANANVSAEMTSQAKQRAESYLSHRSLPSPKSPRLILLATGLLYFTVVSPGGIFLSWLKDTGIDPYYVATFSSAGQAAGIAGSLIVPPMVGRFGLTSAALMLLGFQTAMVAFVALAVNVLQQPSSLLSASSSSSSSSSSFPWSVAVACFGCVVSRLGLWGVDLSLRQIVQSRTRNANRVQTFGLQEGWTQFISLLLYMVVSSDAFAFETLCAMSACALGSALVCVWVDGGQGTTRAAAEQEEQQQCCK